MPLNIVNITNLEGLNPEVNYIDVTKTAPNSLMDCMNVEFYTDGVLKTRKGVPNLRDNLFSSMSNSTITLSTPVLFSQGAFTLLFLYTGQGEIVSYKSVDGALNCTGYNANKETCVLYTKGVYTNVTPDEVLASSVITAQEHNMITPTGKGSFLNKNDTIYFTTKDNGLFKSRKYSDYTDSSQHNCFDKVIFASINIKASVLNTPAYTDVDSPWFMPNMCVRLKAVLKYYREDNQSFYYGPVFDIYDAQNNYSKETLINFTYRKAYITLENMESIKRDNIIDSSKVFLEIYRTRQYKYLNNTTSSGKGVPEVSFHLCHSQSLDSIADDPGSPQTIRLTANDDLISIGEKLYTNSTEQGTIGQNLIAFTASNIVDYKNYTIYSDIIIPSMRPLAILTNATIINANIYINDNTTAIAIDKVENRPTPAPYLFNESCLEVQGAITNDYTSRLAIRLLQYSNVQNGHSTPTVFLKHYAADTAFVYEILYGDATNVPSSGAFFIFVPNSSLVEAFAYSAYTYNTGTKKITFTGTKYYSTDLSTRFPNFFSLDYPYSGYFFNSEYNVPLYPTFQPEPNQLDSAYAGFSIAPVISMDGSTILNVPIAYANMSSLSTITYSDGGTKYLRTFSTINLLGVARKSIGELLDQQARECIHSINTYHDGGGGASSFIRNMAFKTSSPGSFTIMRTDYSDISLKRTTAAPVFDVTIPIDAFKTLSSPNRLKNGILVSKVNRPEEVPMLYGLSPIKIGSENYAIWHTAVNNDLLYIFKEIEGIYAMTLIEGQTIPKEGTDIFVKQINNTIWPIAEYSFQQIDNIIFFLSNDGVVVLDNGQVVNISQKIQNTLQEYYKNANNAITSMADTFTKKYYLRFGGNTNKTLVYNLKTRAWLLEDIKPLTGITLSNKELVFVEDATYPFIRKHAPIASATNTVQFDYKWVYSANGSSYNNGILTNTGAGTAFADKLYLHVARIPQTSANTWEGIFYWKTPSNTYLPVTVTQSGNTIEVTYVNTTDYTNPSSYILVAAVKTNVRLNRFFISSQGKQNQFTECQWQTPGQLTKVSCSFDTDNLTFNTNNKVFSTEKVTFTNTSDIIRVLVPRNAARGRWISGYVEHGVPGEFFQLNGVTWVYRGIDSERNKK